MKRADTGRPGAAPAPLPVPTHFLTLSVFWHGDRACYRIGGGGSPFFTTTPPPAPAVGGGSGGVVAATRAARNRAARSAAFSHCRSRTAGGASSLGSAT